MAVSLSVELCRKLVADSQKMASLSRALFGDYFDADRGWPYGISEEQGEVLPEAVSQSTTAMVLHACQVSVGGVTASAIVPAVRTRRPAVADSSLAENLRRAVELLAASCVSSGTCASKSSTWGDDDPLTLTWLFELARPHGGADAALPNGTVLKKVIRRSKLRISEMLSDPTVPVLRNFGGTSSAATVHVFPVLRLLQLRKAIEKFEGSADPKLADLEEVTDWLERRIHTQLSLCEMPHSDFDPAELVFALEGLLIVAESRATDALLSRTLDVLSRGPDGWQYWRPVRPLKVDAQGAALLPQSVELANSLLRIGERLQECRESTKWTEQVVTMLAPYMEWLGSRLVRGRLKTGSIFTGWQSDHTHSDGFVHLWATSQVLLFVEHYGALVQQHLAKLMRDSTGVAPKIYWNFRRDVRPDSDWAKISDKEPLSGLSPSSPERVYPQVYSTVVAPRLVGRISDASSVILLYGPPGTGKSSFAEDLAAVLDYDLLTISPSDFLRSGEAGVEARAQQVFEMLHEQSETVVLFDEIDRLLVSRDDPSYGLQSDMFQFMTPSMLTKFNDLRRSGQVLSIIATNYEDRIDSAIKRRGRVDESILLLPPDLAQRRKILSALCKGWLDDDAALSEAARTSVLFAYQELKTAVASARARSGIPLRSLMSELETFQPAISMSSYKPRFESGGPAKEVSMLAFLLLEAGRDPFAENDWLRGELANVELPRLISDPAVVETLEAAIALAFGASHHELV